MSFSTIKYPASFGVLKPEIRKTAIEIANVLIEEGLDHSRAEIIALENSREIAQNAISPTKSRIAGCTIHVIPYPDGWAIVSEDIKRFYAVYPLKKEAIIRARSYAKSVKFKLFIHSLNGYIEDCENFMVNLPKKVALNRPPIPKIIGV